MVFLLIIAESKVEDPERVSQAQHIQENSWTLECIILSKVI